MFSLRRSRRLQPNTASQMCVSSPVIYRSVVYTLAASPFKPIPNCCGVFDYSPITCTIFSHYDNNNTNNNNNNTNNNNNNSNTINNKIVTDVSNVGIIICMSI